MPVTVELVYTSVYEYDDIVTLNDNTIRAFPRREPWQEPLESRLETEPPGRVWYYRDRYGNPVARVRITVPHTRVVFRAVARARLVAPYRLRPSRDPGLPLDPGLLPLEARLFLKPSPLVDPEPLRGLAREIAGEEGSLGGVLEALTRWVYERIEYKRGYTTVKTMAHEVVRIGRGVCQDKAHLLIGLLRALGVPARYVSGAFTNTPGETHAWVEVYWPGEGWVPVDPTHNRVYDLGYYYVKYAHGRDYSDVPPVNGYYLSRATGRIALVRVEPRILEGTIPPAPEGSS